LKNNSLRALKGRDRVLGNLLEAARRIATREPLSLDTLAAKGVVRHADAADAKNPGPVEAGVMKEALGKFSAAAAAEEPYALDVFLATMTSTQYVDENNGQPHDNEVENAYTTGDVCPLLPSDPPVFFVDENARVSPCWFEESRDGVQTLGDLYFKFNHEDECGYPSNEIKDSLVSAGVLDPKTGKLEDGGFDDDPPDE
tara:strand:- start:133 stop:729 length:597 start_codon:yes stop_codon:yes gene_type:complete